jgi:AraC-like DNA-binding protein
VVSDRLPVYYERPSRAISGAIVWTRVTGTEGRGSVLPDGCMDLLWMGERLLVAGPDTRAYEPELTPGTRVSGIRFFPGTAPALLGVPAHELRDRRAELTELWPVARVRRLAGLVAAAPDPMSGLAEIVRRRAADLGPADPLLHRIVRGLGAGNPVGVVADELGLGARRLHRISLTSFGYGPKTLARILRMQRALELAHSGIPFAQTAYRAGYADQAHLARDIRELAGQPLGQLVVRGEAGQDQGAAGDGVGQGSAA